MVHGILTMKLGCERRVCEIDVCSNSFYVLAPHLKDAVTPTQPS